MNFIIENFKNPKAILIVSGLIAVIVFSVILIGYESYLRTLIVPAGEQTTLYPDQSITASYVISDHESWNLGNCCSSSPDISAGDYKNELALGYYCHHREGEYTRLYRRITLRFDLSSLPDGASINSAKLYLKPSKISYSQDASVYGASNDNWEEANCFDPNQMKACPQSAAAFQPGSLYLQDTVNINNTNWKNWSVTSFVYSKQNSGSKYVTLHLIGSAEDLTECECNNCWDKRAVNFWGPRSSQKPYLSINHSGGGTPTCGAGLTLCGENCVNLNSDINNCGGCGYKCSSGYKCQSGGCNISCTCGEWAAQTCGGGGCPCTDMHWTRTCAPSGCESESKCWWDSTCGAGLTLCGENCVNLNSDFYNCGSCGYKCSSGYKCQSGTCVKIELDPTCEADGKCKASGCSTGDPDCSCSQQSGNICQTNETCSETSLTHSGSGTCCSVACEGGGSGVTCASADLNCDGRVDIGDYGIVLSWWDKNPSGFTCCQSPDINGDRSVNIGDYGIVLSCWDALFF